jgi:hypothetical protein
MVKEALRPHAEYLVRAGFVVLAIDWRTAVSTATVGVAPRETEAASGLLNSSLQIGASLGLAALVTVAHNRTDQTAVPVALNGGYALGLTLSASLLVVAVLIAHRPRRTGTGRCS